MGAFTPVLTGISAITTAITAVDRAVNVFKGAASDPYERQRKELRARQDTALRQLQQRQALDEQQAASDAVLERQRLAAEAQSAEERRRAALRRAVARQRAQFGASGIGIQDGGSSEAVLLGLFEESETDRGERERLDTLRNAALGQDLENRSRLNVLQRAQLQERQALERMYQET